MSSPSRCSEDHHWPEHRRGHLLVIRRLSSGHPFNHRPSGHLYQRYASPPPQRCPRLPRLHRCPSVLARQICPAALRHGKLVFSSNEGNNFVYARLLSLLLLLLRNTRFQHRCAQTCKLYTRFRHAFFTQQPCSVCRNLNDLDVLAAESGAAARTPTTGCSL